MAESGFKIPHFFDDAAKKAQKAAKGAAKKAGEAASAASDIASTAGGTFVGAASSVGSKVTDAAKKVADSEAGQAVVGTVSNVASDVAENVSKRAKEVSGEVSNAAAPVVGFLVENSPAAILKRKRVEGFRDGINQGAYLAGEARNNYYYAYLATLCYFLRIDGNLGEQELEWLNGELRHLKHQGGLPELVQKKMYEIVANDQITIDEVFVYLDNVSLNSLDSIVDDVQIAIEFDDMVSVKEEAAQQQFIDYIETRAENIHTSEDTWSTRAIESSVKEYEDNIDKINEEFKNKTKLQDKDVTFVILASLLQVARVLIINSLTEVQSAGKGNKLEESLHDKQKQLFDKFDSDKSKTSNELYASKAHILGTPGVPYDITAGGKKFDVFKGANHRFATLGHDPALGLIFGTANIMTNSISTVKSSIVGIGIPQTNLVEYDSLGHSPHFGKKRSTTEMLWRASNRVIEEPSAAAASLIKQVIHIGTDLFTPCGIQLPFANIVLDKSSADKLTKIVSTGDVIKVGAQATLSIFINWLIATLHSLPFVFGNSSGVSPELYQARTKKIILLSNTIGTSSSIVQAALTKNPKCLDLGGAAVLAYRLFTDSKFIVDLKSEFLNDGLDEIYRKRAEGILY